jgi:hypothetical protein
MIKLLITNKKMSIQEKLGLLKAYAIFLFYNHYILRIFTIPVSKKIHVCIFLYKAFKRLIIVAVKVVYKRNKERGKLFSRYIRMDEFKIKNSIRESNREYWRYIAEIAERTGMKQHEVRAWLER